MTDNNNKDQKVEEVKEEVKVEETPKTSQNKNHIVINDAADSKAKWYVVHTYSGHENKVAQALKQRVEAMGQIDYIHELLIPTENKIRVNKGKKQTLAEKIFPGYLLVKMILTDESWLTVRTTAGVTSFVGVGNKPTPISKKEVEAIKKFMEQEAPKYKATFTIGEAVKIVDGPFTDFLGNVESIDQDKGKVKVLVSIFGRETPVELDFLQVTKI
jgi:transcriptional antiterminator NusG